jgi:hypothetical protein
MMVKDLMKLTGGSPVISTVQVIDFAGVLGVRRKCLTLCS